MKVMRAYQLLLRKQRRQAIKLETEIKALNIQQVRNQVEKHKEYKSFIK